VGKQTRCTPAQFREFPITISRNFDQFGRDAAFNSQIVNEWGTRIGERQANPARPGNSAADLHERDQRDRLAGAIEPQIKGFVTIGSSKHPRPGGSMKRGRIGKWRKKRVPFVVFQRINRRSMEI